MAGAPSGAEGAIGPPGTQGGDGPVMDPTPEAIATGFGPTTVWSIGAGRPVLCLHGGPGMARDYLVAALAPQAARRRFVLFDQLGCGPGSPSPATVTAADTIAHAEALAAALAARAGPGGIGLLGHSWGSHVALHCAAALGPACAELLLLDPFPATMAGLGAAMGRLQARFPAAMRRDLGARASRGDGAGMMRLMFPYYCHDPATPFPEGLFRYAPAVAHAVQDSLGDFDATPLLAHLPKRSAVLRGESDFITPAETGAILAAMAEDVVLPRTAHLPFVEDPPGFAAALGRVLDGG